jgi:hypothetical protein
VIFRQFYLDVFSNSEWSRRKHLKKYTRDFYWFSSVDFKENIFLTHIQFTRRSKYKQNVSIVYGNLINGIRDSNDHMTSYLYWTKMTMFLLSSKFQITTNFHFCMSKFYHTICFFNTSKSLTTEQKVTSQEQYPSDKALKNVYMKPM